MLRLKKLTPLLVSALLLLSGCATEKPLLSIPKSQVYKNHSTVAKSKSAFNRPYTIKGVKYFPMASAEGYKERGKASWYGHESGSRTAMGTHFVPKKHTAAHKTLPLPCKVKVTNLSNHRSIDVLVNDRGPFVKNRIIDLSQGAAQAIGISGTAYVQVEYLGMP